MVVVPGVMPLTIPALPIVATPVFEDDHVPPEAVWESVMVAPVYTDDDPEIEPALASGLTATVEVA